MSDLSALETTDPDIEALIRKEEQRQLHSIRLIASENYASSAVMQATGTVLTNKYSEGYAGKRYYEGQDYVDQVESLAIERAKTLFGAEHANVQPYSGSPANQAVYLALCKPGDSIMGMSLPFGGHLTHGWKVNFSGIQYKSVQYELHPETHLIDFDQVREMALEHRPRLIWTGASAYPRTWDFEAFASIAAEVDAVLVADIAHFAGLVVGGVHPHPFPHASIVTTTTHKTLRGPRGGMILSKEEFARDLDRAIFPGLQGGPHNHTTAAIAVALKEASTEDFKDYARRIVANARALADALLEKGFSLVTGGTDNHLILFDATAKGLSGKQGSSAMHLAGLEANSNAIPFDPRKPFDPSGIRLGSASVTSRGMNEEHMRQVAEWIEQSFQAHEDPARLEAIRQQVSEFCSGFPCPGIPT
ncbi:MAG: serine hydroxymethyltransferase [Planctomycetota bacterium]|nr:serine hydroxymethyltransferase [Planctomycetota bacterium]MEE3053458.1 serine hydroxymethyltransferase [Planctomycetota bacterium]